VLSIWSVSEKEESALQIRASLVAKSTFGRFGTQDNSDLHNKTTLQKLEGAATILMLLRSPAYCKNCKVAALYGAVNSTKNLTTSTFHIYF
jgi:hypothetical protein